MKKVFFLIALICLSLSLTACGNIITRQLNTNENEQLKKTSGQITIQEIIEKHIPKPFNPEVYQDNLEFQGKWKGEVMPGLIAKMNELGWEELKNERLGAEQFFSKEINGQQVRISVFPIERGGSKNKKIVSTFVYFDTVK